MSEKARGRIEIGPGQSTIPALSQQSSVTSLHGAAGPDLATNRDFEENERHPSRQIYGLSPADSDSQTMVNRNE
jgi:hypothetical protein